MNGARALDAASIEVIRSHLTSAAEQMRRALVRSAFNPVIYEVLDFGISMYDADLELIAEAPGITSFLGANDYAIVKGVEYVGTGRLEPGDVVLLNYPYRSGAHAYDAMLFVPVFHGDDLGSYVAVRAHWLDLGAKAAGYVLDSTDMHQEGLIFPGTKIVKGGVVDQELVELIRYNSRLPRSSSATSTPSWRRCARGSGACARSGTSTASRPCRKHSGSTSTRESA